MPKNKLNSTNSDNADAWRAFAREAVDSIRGRQHAPGVAILFCSPDAEVIECHGQASVEDDTPLTLDTPIRAGSISKLVTAVAVRQQVEAGTFHFDTKIGDLLDWELPHGAGSASIGQLITHRAGVGERFIGQSSARAEDLLDLSGYLRKTLPPPVFVPGASVTYSNFGISLAALAVETVSGLPFADYARDEIFRPLGMDRATFIPDPGLELEMAKGYHWIFGKRRQLPLRHWKPYPASSLVLSPAELGMFMTAFLSGSCPVLNNPAAMLTEQWSAVPGIPGMGAGFWLDKVFRQNVAWHTGHMPGHRTGFFLFPDAGFGVVLYYNTDENILRPFLEKLCAFAFRDSTPEETAAAAPTTDDFEKYRGLYRHCWHPRDDFGKGAALIGKEGKELAVRPVDAGLSINGIVFEPDSAGGEHTFAATKRGIRVGFVENDRHTVTDLYAGGRDRYARISRFESVNAHLIYFLVSVSVFTICLAGSLIGRFAQCTPMPPVAGWGFALMSACNLLFVLAMVGIMAGGAYKVTQCVPRSVAVTLALPIAGALAGTWAAVALLVAMASGGILSMPGVSAVLTLAGAETLFLWFLHYWNLLGWRY